MTKEELEQRLVILKKALDQIMANGHATSGAIQECEFWLSKINNLDSQKNPVD